MTVQINTVNVTRTAVDLSGRGARGVNGTLTVTSAAGQAVSSRVALAAIASPSVGQSALLTESGREGTFIWRSGDYSAQVTNDTQQAVYVAPVGAPTGVSGAWVRQYSGYLTIEMFGGVADWNGSTGTDNLPAINAAIAYKPDSTRNFSPIIRFGIGRYYVSNTVEVETVCHLKGENHGSDSSSATGLLSSMLVWPTNTLCFRTQNSDTTGATTRAGDATKSSSGSIIEGLCISQATQGTTASAHGVWMRAKLEIRNCTFYQIAGNAIHNVANSGGAGALRGNTNEWRVDNVLVYSCGGNCLYVTGTDANAGYCLGLVTKAGGGCGIYDVDTFGNTYLAPQISGYAGNITGRVSNGGRQYVLIDATAGIGAGTTPGTNNAIWYDVGAGSVYPAWSGASTYNIELPVVISGSSNRSTVVTPYVEGQIPCHNGSAVAFAIAGQSVWTRYSTAFTRVLGVTNAAYSNSGVGAYKSYVPSDATLGSLFEASVGSGDGVILNTQIGPEGGFSWSWTHAAGDQTYGYFNAKPIWKITGVNTAKTFGRAAPVPHMIELRDIALGDSNDGNATRIVGVSAAVPTTGSHAQGEIRFNNAAVASGFVGWVCVAGGTPGTWKTFGAISA